jgi:putative polyhydroxyalkanoate system protein
MSHIDIHAYHTMDHAHARKAADELSQDLADKFDIQYRWDGDVIHFERPGVQGQIEVAEQEILIRAKLGLMLALLRGPIEAEVCRYLKDEFGCTLT